LFGTVGFLLAILALSGIFEATSFHLFWLRGLTNLLWPTLLTVAILFLLKSLRRREASGDAAAIQPVHRGLLIAGLVMLIIGFGPLLVLLLMPRVANEISNTLAIFLAGVVGLPGVILLVAGVTRFRLSL
jgi:hypothetical protein